MLLYFRNIKESIRRREKDGYYGGLCKKVTSGRMRGDCTFTQWANGWFQGLAADGAKYAGWLLVDAAYRRPESPLYGTRPSGFVHDEYLIECPVPLATQMSETLSLILRDVWRRWCPNVPLPDPATDKDSKIQIQKKWSK